MHLLRQGQASRAVGAESTGDGVVHDPPHDVEAEAANGTYSAPTTHQKQNGYSRLSVDGEFGLGSADAEG